MGQRQVYSAPGTGRDKNKKTKRRQWLIGLLVVFCLLAMALLLAWYYLNSKLDLLTREDPVDYSQYSDTSLLEGDDDLLAHLEGIDVMENGGAISPPEGDVIPAPDNVINVLLIGTDERSEEYERARADSMMVLSVNTKENTIKLMSLERALGVSVPNHGDDWLTHTFAYGGADLLLQTIRSYFKIDVSRYVRVNFTAFETAITDIGGVEVELTQEEADYLNGIAGQKKWTAGVTRFDGPTALVYSRIRHLDSDWRRVERQRSVIQGAINQAMRLSPAKIDLLANKLLPMVQTNFTNGEIMRLLLEVPGFAGVQAGQMTVPAAGTYWGMALENGRVVVACDFAENAKIIENFLYGDGSLVPLQEDSSEG